MRYYFFRQLMPAVMLMTGAITAKAQSAGSKPFTLKGQVTAPSYPATLYFDYETGDKTRAKDSVVLKDGHFVFHGTLTRPVSARLMLKQPGKWLGMRNFYLQPGTVEVNAAGPLDSATVNGSPNTAVQDKFYALRESFSGEYGRLRNRAYYNRGNKDTLQVIKEEQDRAQKAFNNSLLAIIKKNPDSYASWDMVYSCRIALNPETITPLFQALSPRFRNAKEGKELATQIANVKKVMVGSPAPGFTQSDVQGKSVTLSSFRGKYVLVDFWASWCGICRAENPNVLRAYNAYKDKGFTVLGVSLDDSSHRNKWLKAIEEDNMPWQQVSDLKGRDNEAAVQYGIKGIPQNVLINPNGVIVAKNLRNKDLMNKLIEIFDKGYNMRLEGDIKGLKDSSIIFGYYIGKEQRQDTVPIHNGRFSWRANMPEPQPVRALIPNFRILHFYSDIGYLQLSGNVDSLPNFTLKGSELNDEAERFKASVKSITGKQELISRKYFSVTKEEQTTLKKQINELQQDYNEQVKTYIRKYPYSLYSLQLVKTMTENLSGPEYSEINPLYMSLPEVLRGTPTGKRIAGVLPVIKRQAIGAAVANFSQSDSTGRKISMADFKGKYVLVDFWASWCGPCRGENPNVLKAYNAFKSKGFTVVGLSLDTDASKWKKAIREDHMPWTQLSDLKGWKNEVAQYYGVHGIPWNLLVGPDGKIIAKGLRGDDLYSKLSELMD